MNRTELVHVWLAYNSLKATKEIDGKPVRRDTDFTFDMNYNLKIMDPEIEGIKALEEQQQALNDEFSKQRLSIIKKKALVDDKGELVVKDKEYQYATEEEKVGTIAELQPIVDTYNDTMKVEMDKYNKFMAQQVSHDIESKLKRHKRNQLDKQLTDAEVLGLSYITD